MATIFQNIFLTKKEKLSCSICKKQIKQGEPFVAESEQSKGTCFACSPFTACVMLPAGDAAMTRRSKKFAIHCAVVWSWNQRRKRFERKGQLVNKEAIVKAKEACEQDAAQRAEKNRKAALQREIEDKAYKAVFAEAIRYYYPYCPEGREFEIAQHACEKYSGRVGRTAKAKQFDVTMIDLAVEAHIRHIETNYDDQFGKGKRKKEIRSDIKSTVTQIITKWKKR